MVMVKLVVDPPPPVCHNRTHQLSCVKVVMLIQIEAEVDPNQSLAFGTALEMIKTRSFIINPRHLERCNRTPEILKILSCRRRRRQRGEIGCSTYLFDRRHRFARLRMKRKATKSSQSVVEEDMMSTTPTMEIIELSF